MKTESIDQEEASGMREQFLELLLAAIDRERSKLAELWLELGGFQHPRVYQQSCKLDRMINLYQQQKFFCNY